MFKTFRIIVLLSILVAVAFYTKLQRLDATSWAQSLPVVIYPINADQGPDTDRYLSRLSDRSFHSIDEFMARSAESYVEHMPQPTHTRLGEILQQAPPLPPPAGGNVLSVMWWSLRLRYWVQTHDVVDTSRDVVKIFVLYHSPQHQMALPHSLGLSKGLIGIVHAFADVDQTEQNNVVIAHELLHTVGATDKYDPTSNMPLFPEGYADPEGTRYPQSKAEIMAGRIPVSATQSRMPDTLRACVIGPWTAREINWIASP